MHSFEVCGGATLRSPRPPCARDYLSHDYEQYSKRASSGIGRLAGLGIDVLLGRLVRSLCLRVLVVRVRGRSLPLFVFLRVQLLVLGVVPSRECHHQLRVAEDDQKASVENRFLRKLLLLTRDVDALHDLGKDEQTQTATQGVHQLSPAC